MRIALTLFLLLWGTISAGQPYYLRKAPVSRYVTHKEAYDSPLAKARGIPNAPTALQENAVRYVARNHFDPLRDKVGGPLFITSFFRSAQLNAAVKGSKYSDHLANNGIAGIDIDQDGRNGVNITNRELFYLIKNEVKFYKLIWEFGDSSRPAWVHVSFSDRPLLNVGTKVYRAIRTRNKTVYEVIP